MSDGTVVTFKGDNVHEVNFEKNNESYISNIAMTGSGSLHLTGNMPGFKLASDLTLAGNSIVTGSKDLVLNGHNLTVNGNFTQDGSLKVNLAGSTMTVNGDYWHKAGKLAVSDHAVLKIAQNYEMRASYASAGTGELQMEKTADDMGENLMDVDGSVFIASTVERSHWQTSGTLRIGGDLTVQAPEGGNGLEMTDGTVVSFKGNKQHEVCFKQNDKSYITNVAVTDNGSIHTVDQTPGFKLVSDAFFADNSQMSGNRALQLNGHTVYVNGSFIQGENLTVDLTDSKMIVLKDYWHQSGILKLNNSTLTIGQNYEMRLTYASAGTGELRMEGDTDKAANLMEVNGDAYLNSSIEHSHWQKNGTLIIGGDLSCFGSGCFEMQDNTITAFRGAKKHTINFAAKEQHTGAIRLGIGDTLTFASNLNGAGRMTDSAITVDPAALASVASGTNVFEMTGKTAGEGTVVFSDGNVSKTKTLYVVDAEGLSPVIIPDTMPTDTPPDDNPPEDDPHVTPKPDTRSAFETIQAETADDYANLSIQQQREDLTVLAYITDGAYAVYRNIDFEDGAQYFYMQANCSSTNAIPGTAELRLDSPDGTLIGSVDVPVTGTEWYTYFEFEADVSLTTGVHDLYLVFSNDTTSYIMNVDYFVFAKEKPPVPVPPAGIQKGDVNDDGSIDLKDVTTLRRYLAGGWNVTINEANSDVNSDGSIDLKDVTILRRYLAGGWDITL